MSTLSQKGVAVNKTSKNCLILFLWSKMANFISKKSENLKYFVNFEIIFGHLKNETHGEMTRYPRDVFTYITYHIIYLEFSCSKFMLNFKTNFLNFFNSQSKKPPAKQYSELLYVTRTSFIAHNSDKNCHFYQENPEKLEFSERLPSLSVYFEKI